MADVIALLALGNTYWCGSRRTKRVAHAFLVDVVSRVADVVPPRCRQNPANSPVTNSIWRVSSLARASDADGRRIASARICLLSLSIGLAVASGGANWALKDLKGHSIIDVPRA